MGLAASGNVASIRRRRVRARRVCGSWNNDVRRLGKRQDSFPHGRFEPGKPTHECGLPRVDPTGIALIASRPGHVEVQQLQNLGVIEVRRVNEFLPGQCLTESFQTRGEGRLGQQLPEFGCDMTGKAVCFLDDAPIQVRGKGETRFLVEQNGARQHGDHFGRRPVVTLSRFDDQSPHEIVGDRFDEPIEDR